MSSKDFQLTSTFRKRKEKRLHLKAPTGQLEVGEHGEGSVQDHLALRKAQQGSTRRLRALLP